MSEQEKMVICVGDIHGFYSKLLNLWSNLESQLNPSQFNNALIIFLGDYCDRGPDTKKVIDFLISLPSKYPNQKHVFLAGNHDIAFSAFLGLLPRPLDGSGFNSGFKEYAENEEREGWYKGLGFEDMYLQGRRWAGSIRVRFNTVKGTEYKGSIYDSAPTFESYGVPHGSAELKMAVPEEHKKFLADLVWVHEEDNVCAEIGEGAKKRVKLIAVHGGLLQGRSVDEQIKYLKSRDTSVPKIECLSGRKTVWEMPEELKLNPTVLVSGHHGKLSIDGLRLVIDEGGGLEQNPVAAIVLPSMKIVRDTDSVQSTAKSL